MALPDGFDPNVDMLQGSAGLELTTGDTPLKDLQVDILITEDLIPALQIDTLGNPVGGLSFQLNCNGAPNVQTPWEQFCISLDPYSFFGTPGAPKLSAEVQFWSTVTDTIITETGDHALLHLPVMDVPGIPAGYRLRIALKASKKTVNEAQFWVFDPEGKQKAHWDIKMSSMTLGATGKKVSDADLSEIIHFQLVIVGRQAAQLTELLSGAGTITYTSTDQLIPSLVQNSGTGESSNCIYSTVAPIENTTFLQNFQVLP